MRAAEIRPDPNDVRDLAYGVRDMLTNLLTNARSPLCVPLGNLNKFGYLKNALAYEIDGWRGDRAHYGPNDEEGYMDSHAALLAERQVAVGAIALAYGDAGLNTDNLAPSPHITIARAKEAIPDYRMRGLRGGLADLLMEDVYLGDPVISVKLYRDIPAEIIHVKHAYDSLAPDMSIPLAVPDMTFELDDDRYAALASRVMYA
jgi:hypothetical protein